MKHFKLFVPTMLGLVAVLVIALAAIGTSPNTTISPRPVASTQVSGDSIANYSLFTQAPARAATSLSTPSQTVLEQNGTGTLQAVKPVSFPDGTPGYATANSGSFCLFRASATGTVLGGSCLQTGSSAYPGNILFHREDGAKRQDVYGLYPDGVTGLVVRGDGGDYTVKVQNNLAKFTLPSNSTDARVFAVTAGGEQDTHIFGK